MTVYPADHVVTVTLQDDPTPSQIHALRPGVTPNALRVGWTGRSVTLANDNLATLFRAMNTLGLAGAMVTSATYERGSAYLEISDFFRLIQTEQSNVGQLPTRRGQPPTPPTMKSQLFTDDQDAYPNGIE